MRTIILSLVISVWSHTAFAQVGIGTTTPAASAALDITSTTKGLLPPRMTEAQRNILSTTATAGLLIWCSNCGTSGELQVYNGSAWTNLIGNTTSAATYVTIGTQNWATKNLDVTTYRDGTEIPQVTNYLEWRNLTTGAWCYYANETANGTIYGKLYNWYAVNDSRGLAPAGWHIPTYSEWTTLTTFIGGESVAGGKLKETGTTHWTTPNTAATDNYGFTALPGGSRQSGVSYYINEFGTFWSSSPSSVDNYRAIVITLDYNSAPVYYNIWDRSFGYSVRCIKD